MRLVIKQFNWLISDVRSLSTFCAIFSREMSVIGNETITQELSKTKIENEFQNPLQ